MKTRTAVILAGGLGTRLRSVVTDVPKPMAPIEGRPFLEYLLDYWIDQGIERFILSVGYRSEVIIDHFGNGYRQVPIAYAFESQPLGTGGGLLQALEHLTEGEESFLLLNGDTWFALDLMAFQQFAEQHRAGVCLALFRASEADRYMGIDIDTDGHIHRFASQRGQLGALANGGVYWVRRTSLNHLDYQPGQVLSLEEQLLPKLMDNGTPLLGFETSGSFIDIGLPHDYHRAGALLPLPAIRYP